MYRQKHSCVTYMCIWCSTLRGSVISYSVSYVGAPASSLVPEIGCHEFYILLLNTYNEIMAQ